MGSLYSRRGMIWLRVKIGEKWNGRPTGLLDTPENRKEAKRVLAEREALIALAAEGNLIPGEPITVRAWARVWLKRHDAGKSNVDDEGRWKHLDPLIGKVQLDELRPRHVREALRELKAGKLSARSVHHCYSVLRRMMREAKVDELISESPCTILPGDLPKKRDRERGWREGALYSPAEILALATDPRIPEDRRLLYALLGYAGLRFGEAAELRWKDYDPKAEPLGRLTVARGVSRGEVGGTKTERSRAVPVHPALAAVLAAWKLPRKPGPEDLVAPSRAGTHRLPQPSLRSLHRDLDTLGAPHRRLHDLRRSWVTWARDSGGRVDVVRWISHGPSESVLDSYTSTPWAALCEVVAGLRMPAAKEAVR